MNEHELSVCPASCSEPWRVEKSRTGVVANACASAATQFPEKKRHLPEVTQGLKQQHTAQIRGSVFPPRSPCLARTVWIRRGDGWMPLDILPGIAWNGIKYLSVAGGLQRTFEMDCVFMCLRNLIGFIVDYLVSRNRHIIFPGSGSLGHPGLGRSWCGLKLPNWLGPVWVSGCSGGGWQEELCVISLWGGLISSEVSSQRWPALLARGGIPQERTKGTLSPSAIPPHPPQSCTL